MPGTYKVEGSQCCHRNQRCDAEGQELQGGTHDTFIIAGAEHKSRGLQSASTHAAHTCCPGLLMDREAAHRRPPAAGPIPVANKSQFKQTTCCV
jgi:hypothetical protein